MRVKHLLREFVTRAQPCAGHVLMVFTDASNIHWEAMAAEVPEADLWSGVHSCEMQNASLAFL